MKKVLIGFCIIFLLVACATKKENIKKNAGLSQPTSNQVETEVKKTTKWDKEGEKGLNKENIGEEGLSEKSVKENSIMETKSVKDAIAEFSSHNIHFDYDDYKIKAEDIPYLESLAQWLEKHPSYKLTIEGHCDERGSDLYNLALGEKRANATKDFLVSLGVDANRIDCISYGEEKPLDPRHNEAAWAKNRRCHFDLTK